MQNSKEWIDGFLFVGNQRALDFLNTRLIKDDGPIELLTGAGALERWLMAAGVLSTPKAKAAVRAWGESRPVQAFLRSLLVFRENLRAAVLRFESGQAPDRHFVAELNQKLRAFPNRYQLTIKGESVHREILLALEKPEDLWSAFAEPAAALFAEAPSSRVRKCPGCVVHFRDISKKGSRRWCSMNMCGNREKVAAYRDRQRESA